jgi:hypothetical protein
MAASFLGAAGVVSPMMILLLIAGIGFLLAGLLGIVVGIPVKEFSFGNTLILAGAVATCTGMIMLGLWTIVRELKNIAQRLDVTATSRMGTPLLPPAASAARDLAPENSGFLFSHDQPSPANADDAEPGAHPAPSSPPWREETAARDRKRDDAPPVPVKQRRNLLFSSSSRKERERAEGRTSDPSAVDLRSEPAAAPPPPRAGEAPPATFEDAWPQPERSRTADAPPQRRSGRTPSTFSEPNAGAAGADRYPPAGRNEEQPPVTVLKSGVVDGMAYSLYSDGSIEAQMPEGMMRFASIEELRAHLDQRS